MKRNEKARLLPHIANVINNRGRVMWRDTWRQWLVAWMNGTRKLVFFSVVDRIFLKWPKKQLCQFGHDVRKYRLVNTFKARFNTIMRQMTEMSQRKNSQKRRDSHDANFIFCRLHIIFAPQEAVKRESNYLVWSLMLGTRPARVVKSSFACIERSTCTSTVVNHPSSQQGVVQSCSGNSESLVIFFNG